MYSSAHACIFFENVQNRNHSHIELTNLDDLQVSMVKLIPILLINMFTNKNDYDRSGAKQAYQLCALHTLQEHGEMTPISGRVNSEHILVCLVIPRK